jgi:hypothetical protein
VSSLEDYAVTRKDGKKIKRITAKHSTKKRQRISSSDEDEQPKTKDRASIRSSLTTSKGVSSSKLLNSKNTFLSQHDSSESSILQHASTSDSENYADETPGTSSGIQRSPGYRPIKALKGSLESKLTRQESRITAVENNMQEMPEMYGGKNLNDLFAPSAQRLAIKLAIAIKGDDLKDCVLTENGEASANSDKRPWSGGELNVFRRVMMRKCKLNSEQFSKKFSCYRTAVNSRSRYEHRIYLKRLGIEPNSKQARMCSHSTKNRRQSNSDDVEPSTKTVKKTVSFSDKRVL